MPYQHNLTRSSARVLVEIELDVNADELHDQIVFTSDEIAGIPDGKVAIVTYEIRDPSTTLEWKISAEDYAGVLDLPLPEMRGTGRRPSLAEGEMLISPTGVVFDYETAKALMPFLSERKTK